MGGNEILINKRLRTISLLHYLLALLLLIDIIFTIDFIIHTSTISKNSLSYISYGQGFGWSMILINLIALPICFLVELSAGLLLKLEMHKQHGYYPLERLLMTGNILTVVSLVLLHTLIHNINSLLFLSITVVLLISGKSLSLISIYLLKKKSKHQKV